jgi:hypothetical protein
MSELEKERSNRKKMTSSDRFVVRNARVTDAPAFQNPDDNVAVVPSFVTTDATTTASPEYFYGGDPEVREMPSNLQGVRKFQLPVNDPTQVKEIVKTVDTREGDFKQSVTVWPTEESTGSGAKPIHVSVSPEREDNIRRLYNQAVKRGWDPKVAQETGWHVFQ